MHPYKTISSAASIPHTGGGLCPYCKQYTGWHIRRMGVIPNPIDHTMCRPATEALIHLNPQGYTAAKFPTTPGIDHPIK